MAAGGAASVGGSGSSSSSPSVGGSGGGKKKQKRKAPGSNAIPYTPVKDLPDAHAPQASDVAKVQVGHKFCNIETGVVLKIDVGYIHVKTEGGPVMIAKDVFGYKTYSSPDQHERTITTCQSGLIKILRQVGDHMFFVIFDKKDGTERHMYATMKGHCDTDFGRSKVNCLNFDGPTVVSEERQVDHRTLKELRFKGVRYVIKKAKKTKKTIKDAIATLTKELERLTIQLGSL